MAVVPTGAIYNWLTFGGVDSRDYGIYITGEGVYNSPERSVEMMTIPGRNGDFALDMGRWENIEVIYPASTGQDSQADFRTAVSDFRNAIGSLRGYQRLTDTYHPDEYRMGLFLAGLDVEPAAGGKAGEFELRFNCKPQRFLTSGETAITVASGGTVTNPTPYKAAPLLAIDGYGDVAFNGFTVTLDQALYGDIEIVSNKVLDPAKSLPTGGYWDEQLDTSQANSGDDLSVSVSAWCSFPAKTGNTYTSVVEVTPPSNGSSFITVGSNDASIYVNLNPLSMAVGSAFSEITDTATYKFTYKRGGTSYGMTFAAAIKVRKGSGDSLRITCSGTFTPDSGSQPQMSQNATVVATIPSVIVDSTQSYLGNPTYIDCDLGEAYRIENDEMILLNRYIMLGSELPTLAPGTNSFTLDNTITDLEVTPRWWIL